jgi:hypothetical protein
VIRSSFRISHAAVARDFTYRVAAELGGSGTEGPARINDFWVGYSGFAPFVIQIGAFSPPANLDDSINVESSLFLERPARCRIPTSRASTCRAVGS